LNGPCNFLGDEIEKKKKESLVGENQSRHFQQQGFFFVIERCRTRKLKKQNYP